MKIKKPLLTAMAAFALILICSPVKGATDDEWKWEISPYFYAPSVDLEATVEGTTVPIDLSFSDVLDDFDVFGVSARVEGWKGEWGIICDGMWTDLDGDFGLNDSIGVDIEDATFDLQAGYRIDTDSSNGQGLIFDLMPGLRYHYLKQKIKIRLPEPVPFQPPSQGGSEDWLEPLIACRVAWPFAEKWSLLARGDLSGFGIGSASDLTWSVNAGLDFQFAKNWAAKLGYRYYDIDYSRGSGTNEFGLDGSMDGVMLGLTWKR